MRFHTLTYHCALLGLLFAVSARAELEWPEFRGPTAQGISTATNVPVLWTATNNIAWKTAIPGKGWSSPVLLNGRIYLTTAVEEGLETSLRAVCVDEQDGRLLWNAEALRTGAEATKQIHSKNSLASPTPIIRDGRLYVHFGHMGTAALDLEGRKIWTQTSVRYQPVHGNGGSPALVNGVLAFSCDGASDPFFTGLDAATGAVLWKTPRNTTARAPFSFSTPLVLRVSQEDLLISPASGFVGAYSPTDGSERWRVRYGEGYSVVPRPVFGNGLLYLSSGFDRAVLYALDPVGAKGDVTETHVRWKQTKGAPLTPSPLLIGRELYVVSDAGVASCLDALTGEQIWSERLGGNFSASPVSAENRIYFLNEAGTTFVIATGRNYQLLAKNVLDERSLASPAVDHNSLFIRTEAHLWRCGRSSVRTD